MIDGLIQLIDRQLEYYYLLSFRRFPQEITSNLLGILARLGELSSLLDEVQRAQLNRYLQQILDGHENCDYVTVRDILYYEIKPFLKKIKSKQ